MLKDLLPWKKKKSELRNYKEGDVLGEFNKRFNDLFENFFDDFETDFKFPSLWKSENNWFKTPEVDVSENKKEIKVEANLPGLDEKDIKVNLDGGRLIIEGEHNEEKEDKNKKYYFSERRYGKFQRVIPVNEDIVDKDNIKASLKKGVLKVTLPKVAGKEQETKKIKITCE